MRIEIRSRGLKADERLRESITQRLQLALGRCGTRVVRATVFLADLNGPRGGVDKHCRVLLRLRSGTQVTLQATEADVHTAVAQAADRAGLSLKRQVERRRLRIRRSPGLSRSGAENNS
jgi:putative sigma-54 modulation protein